MLAWVNSVLPVAREVIAASENKQWLRCGGTWHAGVNILPNDKTGALPSGPALGGKAIDFVRTGLAMRDVAWDRAQISVCYPGYPLPMDDESQAAFRFRRDRDAAHVDGLHREGPDNRRYLREHHRYILGIPLVKVSEGASPLALWEGSHRIVGTAFEKVYGTLNPARWGDIDVTDVYRETREKIFQTCKRITVTARPGECYLLHRLTMHGPSPWQDGADAGPDGRMIAYFRPTFADPGDWLFADRAVQGK